MLIESALSIIEFGGVVLGVTAGGLGIRAMFAHAAVKTLRRNEAPKLEKFKNDHLFIRPLPQEFRAAAEELLSTVRASREMRAAVMQTARDMQLPDNGVELIPKLQDDLEKMQINFLAIMKQVHSFKAGFLIKDQVHERIAHMHGLKTKVLHLSKVDKAMVHVLDRTGVLGGITHATDKFNHGLAALYGHHEDYLNNAVEVVLFPWVISGTRTAIQEFKWLMNDETSFADSLRHGFVPSMLRTGLRTIGVALDTSFGWVTMGLFTGAAIAIGKFLSNEHLKEELDKVIRVLNRHIDIIRDRQHKALKRINKAQREFKTAYLGEIDKCPDIADVPVLRKWSDQAESAYGAGVVLANALVSAKTMAIIADIPPTRFRDKLRGVDTRGEIVRLYRATERELHSRHLSIKHRFAMAYQDHTEEGIKFMLNNGVFPNPETLAVLKKLKPVNDQLPKAYESILTVWQKACEDMWRIGTENIATITQEEHVGITEVAERETVAMKPVRRQIRTLQKRLRYKNLIEV